MAQDGVMWPGFVHVVMFLRVVYKREIALLAKRLSALQLYEVFIYYPGWLN